MDRLFDQAADLSPGQRQEFLREVGRSRPELARRLEELLVADGQGEAFLKTPVARLSVTPPESDGAPRRMEGRGEPRHIGSYRILRELGRGGMGEVYLAERKEAGFQRRVALKVIRAGLDSPAMRARFLRERSALSRLEHPGIARLYDGGTPDGGSPYLVMERIEGRPIDVYCREEQLSATQCIQLFLEVCDAVAYAHRNLVVHRDIKPSNVLVTDDGRPILLDFGIAKLLQGGEGEEESEGSVTRTEHRPMSLRFASPEQVLGDDITTGSDVYSLGVLLYFLLTGCSPYRRKADHLPDLEQAIVDRPPIKPSEARPSEDDEASRGSLPQRLAGDLDTILLFCLKKRPEERYESVTALAEDLRRALADRPILARPEPWSSRARRFCRRHGWGTAAALVIAALTLAFLVTLTFQNQRIRRERDFAEEERVKATTTLELLAELLQEPDSLGDFPHRSTAREVLARQPEVAEDGDTSLAATRLVAIGRAYGSLEDWRKAAEAAQRALEIRRRLHGEEHLLTAESFHDSGRFLAQVQETDLAIEHLRQALDIRRRLLPEGDVALAATEMELGRLLFQQARLGEAKTLLESARRTWLRHYGADHLKVAEVRHHLATLLRAEGSLLAAEEEFGQALAIRRRALGEDHARTLSSLNELALTRGDRGAFESAIRDLRELLEAQVRIAGPEHRRTLIVRQNLAQILARVGAFGEAKAEARKALSTWQEEHPEQWEPQVAAQTLLGRIALGQGKPKDGEEQFRNAVDIAQRHLGPEHWRAAVALIEVAEALRQQGEGREAERILRQVRDLKVSLYGEEDAGVLIVDRHLTRLLLDRGQWSAAERSFRRIREAYRRSGVSASRAALDDLALAHVLLSRGELGAAEPLIDGAVDTLRRELHEQDPRLLWAEILELAHRGLTGPADSSVLSMEKRLRRLEALQGPLAFETQQARILLDTLTDGHRREGD